MHPEQHQQSGADLRHPPAADLDRCAAHALDQGSHERLGLAQLGGGPLGRDDVEVHPGAEFQPGEMGQPGQDVDPPAELLGPAGSRPHPEVERGLAPSLRVSRLSASWSRAAPRGPSSSYRAAGVRGAIISW